MFKILPMFGCIQSYIGVDGLWGMGHGGAVAKTLELFTPDGTIMTHKGSSINYVITFGGPGKFWVRQIGTRKICL